MEKLIKALIIISICGLVLSVILAFIAFSEGNFSSAYHSIFNVVFNLINLYALKVLYKTT